MVHSSVACERRGDWRSQGWPTSRRRASDSGTSRVENSSVIPLRFLDILFSFDSDLPGGEGQPREIGRRDDLRTGFTQSAILFVALLEMENKTGPG
jgi:hypothetical protein